MIICPFWESPEVLKIYHLSHEEQQILGQLNKVKSFPARSVKPLTQMIKKRLVRTFRYSLILSAIRR